jgi:hypothetical protein
MDLDESPQWRDHLISAAWVARSGNATAFYRAARAGTFRRLASGVFVPEKTFASLDADERHLALVYAASMAAPIERARPLSHLSAAGLWRLPTVEPWPNVVHTVAERGSSLRSRGQRVIHADGVPDRLDRVDGLAVTTLSRTVVDVARTSRFSTAVAMIDHAMRASSSRESGLRAARVTRQTLLECTGDLETPRGRRRLATAVAFADGRSGSPGESVSRCGMHVLGLPMPTLQKRFVDAQGEMFVDFWWEDFTLVGEFDGLGKYLRPEMLRGRTTAEAVIAEKRREDRLRALGPAVVRWDWPVARSLPRLAASLRGAGLRS